MSRRAAAATAAVAGAAALVGWWSHGTPLQTAVATAAAAVAVWLLLLLVLRDRREHRRRAVDAERTARALRLLDDRQEALHDHLRATASATDEALVRLTEELASVARQGERTAPAVVQEVRASLDRRLRREFRQVEATTQLAKLLDLPLLTATRGWAASPDLLVHACALLAQERPRTLVECGSGTSTVLLAAFARRIGLGLRIVSLDHDERFAATTRRQLALHGLDGAAEVRTAPLVVQPVPGAGTVPWYDPAAVADLRDVDMLLVDGPPAATGPRARYPALPLLRERLSGGFVVLVDDTVREEDAEVVDRWSHEHGLEVERLDAEKGAAVLRRPRPGPATTSQAAT